MEVDTKSKRDIMSIEQKKPVRGFKTNSNFFANGGRHIGFEGLSTIFELVDNSIDAEANQIVFKLGVVHVFMTMHKLVILV